MPLKIKSKWAVKRQCRLDGRHKALTGCRKDSFIPSFPLIRRKTGGRLHSP